MSSYNPLNTGCGGSTGNGSYDPTCICDTLNTGLDAIVQALTEIDDTLKLKTQTGCQIVSECQDEIINLIDEHFKSSTKSCDECKADVQAGLGGTIEFAVACAGACINETKNECQYVEGQGEPSTCTSCGCEPCVCQDGTCVSEDPTACEKPKKKYIGWCNQFTGQVEVTEADGESPGGLYAPISTADTEQAALEAAIADCQTYQPGIDTSGPTQGGSVGGDYCDIGLYANSLSTAFIAGAAESAKTLEAGSTLTSEFLKTGFEGFNVGSVGGMIRAAVQLFVKHDLSIAGTWIPQVSKLISCNSPAFDASASVLSTIGVANKLTGIDLLPYAKPWQYVMHAQCRQVQLEPSQALDAYLADTTGKFDIDTHFAIAGLCPQSVAWSVQASKAKAEPQQLATMLHRDIINVDTYHMGMRQLGYVDPGLDDDIFKISRPLPDIATATRMGQAGVQTDAVADKYGLDSGNDAILQGTLHDFIKGNGITDDVAKLFWRSHWQTPQIGNLIEFYQRLRNDKNLNANGELDSAIDDTLTASGIAPFWQPYFKAVFLSPLLKRDIRVAYTSGALSDDDLRTALQTTGHDDNAIDVITRELKPARRQQILSHVAIRNWLDQHLSGDSCAAQLIDDGFTDTVAQQAMKDSEHQFDMSSWAEAYVKGYLRRDDMIALMTAYGITGIGADMIADKLSFRIVDHQSLRNYIAGTVTRNEAAQEMKSYGVVQQTIDSLLRDADAAVTNALAVSCSHGIQRQYVLGGISAEDASSQLIKRSISVERANQLVSNFDCSKNADGKEVAVEKLCHWLYIGAIGQVDFYQRLLRLGYKEGDAAILLQDCVQSNTLKAIKEAKTLAKELQSEADKEQRAIAKANAAIVKNAASLKAARAKAVRLREVRDTQQLSAAEKLYKKVAGGLQASLLAVKSALQVGQSQFGLSLDESLRLAILAAEGITSTDVSDYVPFYSQLAEAAMTSGNSSSADDTVLEPSTNGLTHPSEPTTPLE